MQKETQPDVHTAILCSDAHWHFGYFYRTPPLFVTAPHSLNGK